MNKATDSRIENFILLLGQRNPRTNFQKITEPDYVEPLSPIVVFIQNKKKQYNATYGMLAKACNLSEGGFYEIARGNTNPKKTTQLKIMTCLSTEREFIKALSGKF